MPSRRLDGQIALVTGGSRGIGAAICRKLAKEGATVVMNYNDDAEPAERICDEIILAGGKAQAYRCEMEVPDQIESLFKTIKKTHPRLDILVNNAAVADMIPIEAADVAQFARFFNVNVRGPMLAIQQSLPLFGQEGGSIINISSAMVRENSPKSMLYASTKAAIDAMTKCMSKELGPRGIRVNSVSPGLIDTKLSRGSMPAHMFDWIAKHTPLRRLGKPEDIAGVVAFLASADACWVTGEIIGVTGGM
ncbi:MAG TPA: glucose 1-dehydrogenase [Gemmatales bacterium]|nr:glucose 1-dehydrogenase [Gemmatales bacterium]